jgi:RNA polymerase II C-terminal domain phosphatase-like 3/4
MEMRPEQSNQKTISMRYLHSDLVINKEYVREMKEREASRLIAQRKLSLVFDLDHTLLNSSHVKDITEAAEMPLLNDACEKETKALAPSSLSSANNNKKKMDHLGGRRSLYFLPHIQMWTKLRPYYLKLLEEASKLFDMHVYTMGERGYAMEMVKLLDPDRTFFGDHVVSKNDSTSNSVKDLDVLIGSEKTVLILDDSPKVWRRHRANVLEVERYHFFPSSLKHFGIRGKCLLHRKHDEDAGCGPLSSVLSMLKEIHREYFSHENPGQNDVREILKQKKKKVLVGCRICFSRVFPKGEEKPEQHPLWKVAEEFGALCTRYLDASVTHVVTTSVGTEKAIQGEKMGKLVVRPEWLYASVYHFKKSNEKRYNLVSSEAATDKKKQTQEDDDEGNLEEGEIEA